MRGYFGVRTGQVAEGRGPKGQVGWWPQSQTHPECCVAHPARPGAGTPPCREKAEMLRPHLASLKACSTQFFLLLRPPRPTPKHPKGKASLGIQDSNTGTWL